METTYQVCYMNENVTIKNKKQNFAIVQKLHFYSDPDNDYTFKRFQVEYGKLKEFHLTIELDTKEQVDEINKMIGSVVKVATKK
jgi:hypothetical protein